jgi:ribosomal protein L11 methyltransferase
MTAGRGRRFVWRKVSAAKWEDAWTERLAAYAGRLAITAFPRSRMIRLEAFALPRKEAEKLLRMFGGGIAPQKEAHHFTAVARRAPIRVRKKLLIVGSERARQALLGQKAGRRVLVIPAELAFGTGDHVTTATCLRLLADLSDQFRGQVWEMLDVGCGTGILAIAARVLGAARAEAVDVDSAAVRVARSNVRINQVDGVHVVRRHVRRWQPTRKWEVIVANLHSGLLVEIAAKIAAANPPRGQLIISGILRYQVPEVVAAYEGLGFRFDRSVYRGKWFTGLATHIAHNKASGGSRRGGQ